jgi:hypothetical protein
MLMPETIHRVEHLVDPRSALSIPMSPGVYAFWWVGPMAQLLDANRLIVLRGPRGMRVKVHYHDWWPKDAPYPCLYVGKATKLKRRFGQHLLRGTFDRAHEPLDGNHKATPKTTTCQLRFGIEHVFPLETKPLTLIDKNVGFSWCDDFPDNAVAERFFAEDRLIGHLRPWFNIDSER